MKLEIELNAISANKVNLESDLIANQIPDKAGITDRKLNSSIKGK